MKAGRFVKNRAIPFAWKLIKSVIHPISVLPGKIRMKGKLCSSLTGMIKSIVKKIPNEDMRRKVDW